LKKLDSTSNYFQGALDDCWFLLDDCRMIYPHRPQGRNRMILTFHRMIVG